VTPAVPCTGRVGVLLWKSMHYALCTRATLHLEVAGGNGLTPGKAAGRAVGQVS
jgi:hypothetical protein